MASEFKLPELGDGIEEAQVVSVMVAEGDEVDADAGVIEVETDKAVTEVPISAAGTIASIKVGEGDTVKPGDVILTYEPGDNGAAAAPEAEPAKEEPKQEAAPEAAPAEPEPAKPRAAPAPVKPSTPVAAVAPGPDRGQPVFAAPNVRKFAREVGVDLTRVEGSGPGGRIDLEDVKAAARQQTATVGGGGAVAAAPLPDFSQQGPIDVAKMSMIAKKTAEHMAMCWATIPHVTLHDTVDVTDLEAFRKQHKSVVERAGGKLTVTSILVKLLVGALKEFPILNASVDMANHQIIYKQYYNIGVAADTPRGLVVPVVRDADQLSLTQVSVTVNELAAKAREGKLSLEQMQGGTFTITNLGGIGIGHFAPIVNHPEVGILGVGRAVATPVDDGQGGYKTRLMMPISISFDHRIVNGADGARFVNWLKRAIEQPLSVLIDA